MTNAQIITIVDTGSFFLSLLGAFYFVYFLRNIKSVFIGGVFIWLFGIFEGLLMFFIDPYRASLLDHVWIIAGLPAGIFAASLIYITVNAASFIIRKLQSFPGFKSDKKHKSKA